MKFAHGFALALAALLSYFVLALLFGVYQRYPLVHMLLTVIGIVVMAVNMQKNFSRPKFSAILFSGLLLAIFVWWSQSYSTYGEPAQQFGARGSDAMPSFVLKTSEGENFDFNAAIKKTRRTLLVFNRGVW
ncbi:MAG: hypothetical protein AAB354_08135 [candidate division KSB1 bacterium]